MRKLLLSFIAIKVMSFLVIIWAFRLLPFCVQCWWGNFLYPRPQALTWVSALKTWDSQHYLYLAEVGYQPDQISNAFFPLWPILIRGGLVSALILANSFSLIAVGLFYKLVEKQFGKRMADRAGMLLITFPTAFYLHLPYSEALFLLLLVWSFYALSRVSWFLLPLTRIQGFLMLGVGLWQRKFKLLPYLLLGMGAYAWMMKAGTGSVGGGLAALKNYVTQYSIGLLLRPWEWVRINFLDTPLVLHNFNASVIDRLFFGGFLLTVLLAVRQKLEGQYMSVMIFLGIVVALSGRLVSFPRYLLPVFPIYIVWARYLKDKYMIGVLAGLMLQTLFLVMHVLNYWVA